jgi:DNA polymerase III subunit beta
MDLTIPQVELARVLRLVGRAAATKPKLPVLQNVLVECEFGRVTLTATDIELAISSTVPADIASAGRAAIPVRLLADYVAELPPEPLRLALEAGQRRVKVSCGRFTANLATIDPEEFPVLPPADESRALALEAARLRQAIDRVVFAAARDDARPVLGAVLLDFGPEGLTLAAADGLRLARVRLPGAATTAHQFLLPARAMAEAARVLAGAEAARLVPTPDERGIYLISGQTRLYTRLIEGRYPDIDRVIPREWRTRVTVDAESLRQNVRVASIFGGGEARAVLLEATPGCLRLTARGEETGDARSEIPASMEGEAQGVALNTRLLTDVLEAPRSQQLELSWAGPHSPVVVREVASEDADDLWVVMPLHDPALVRQQAVAA